jgi:hypothetical protein
MVIDGLFVPRLALGKASVEQQDAVLIELDALGRPR